jgi:hypothetical protein
MKTDKGFSLSYMVTNSLTDMVFTSGVHFLASELLIQQPGRKRNLEEGKMCWTVVRSELGKVMLIGGNAVRSVFN